MLKSKSSKKQKPASSNGVPVLKILYSLLALGLFGVGGWLYWSDRNIDHTSLSAAGTDIGPVEPAATHTPAPHMDDSHGEPSADTSHAVPRVNEPSAEKAGEETPHDAEAAHTAPAEDDSHSDPHKKDETQTAHQDREHTEKLTPELPAPHPEDPSTEPPADDSHASAPPTEEEAPEQLAKTAQPLPEKQKIKTPQLEAIDPPADVAALAPVPDPELIKKSDFGFLPVIGPTGRQAWRIYARPFDDPLDRPRISIVISEMGMSSSATKSAIQNLQGAVTLSFNPYARDLQSWIEQARAAGHEILLQLPMEPFGYPKNDPGPHSLLTSLTDQENLNRLDWMLGRFTGYSGVTNQMGSKFTATAADIQPVLNVIKSRGLLFLDGRTSAKSVAGQLAAKSKVPVAINNRFLDHKADRITIDARLKDLERIARYTGTAVGIGYPYPVTLERIALWTQGLARKGFVLVPISAAVNRQEIE